MTELTPAARRELREKHEKATPLPWVNMDDDTFFGELRACSDDRFELVAVMPKNDDRTSDFEYMAAAANLAPALLDEVERLEQKLADTQGRFSNCTDVAREQAQEIQKLGESCMVANNEIDHVNALLEACGFEIVWGNESADGRTHIKGHGKLYYPEEGTPS